jgi:PIN domain nuclease of toxin-antitoxin system
VFLLDTHVWAWALTEEKLLSLSARRAMNETSELFLSAVSFYEIAHKVRLGKWPEMAAYADRLCDLAKEQSMFMAPVTAEIALIAGQLDWTHRDPFDRHLAATAQMFGLDFISADATFDAVAGLRRIWE